MDTEEIKKALGAHGAWKNRLVAAIDSGSSEFNPTQVEPDNQCTFGKWLYALPPADRKSEHYARVQTLHAAFHKEAAQVLRLALSGKKTEATNSMTSGGRYMTTSADLILALAAWQKAIGG